MFSYVSYVFSYMRIIVWGFVRACLGVNIIDLNFNILFCFSLQWGLLWFIKYENKVYEHTV